MKKNLSILFATILSVTMLLTGCGGGGDQSTTSQGGDMSAAVQPEQQQGPKTLTIAIQDEIEGTDIQQISWENVVQALIYEPLIVFNEDLTEMHPSFAESYEISDDGLEVVFHLFEDSKFSNGDPLTAESVKKSVERFIEISDYAEDLEAIKTVEVVDEHTVKYILSEPAPYMWASVCSTYGGIVNVDRANEVSADEFNRMAIGNGPFRVKEWAQGSHIVLERNEFFRTAYPNAQNKGPSNIDEITIRFIADPFTRVSELESGSVDIMYDAPIANIDDLLENSDLISHSYKQAGVTYMLTQTFEGPTQDINVRKAIAHAINKEELKAALNDVVTPMYGFISEAQAGYSPTKETEYAGLYGYDLEKAKAYLKEAGYEHLNGDGIVEKNGENLTLTLFAANDRDTIRQSAPVIQNQLKAVGIDLQIREYEASYIKQMCKDNTFQLGTRNYVWNDADILYYVFTENSGYPWSDPIVTEKLDIARYTVDPAERVKKYEEAQDALMDCFPAIALFADNYYIMTKSNVSGLNITTDGRTFIYDITKE